MARILLTGALGHLGTAVARELAGAGHALTCVDRLAPAGDPPGTFARDDLSDVGRLAGLMKGMDAVVHCAAIATLHAAPEETVFSTNVTTTANMLLAAERSGIGRFVYASSQSALGFAYAPRVVPPDRLPVDETHPCRPVEGYGLSKRVGEQLCEMVSARSAMATVALRFPVIWSHERFKAHTRKRLDDPVQAAKSQWAYVDLRDAATGCRLAAEIRLAHLHRVINIGTDRPFELADAAATLRTAYGDVEGLAAVAASGGPVFDASRASAELGFRPRWRWTRAGVEAA
ncbi:MAG: NAD(P)-dependent oxidoreductase [Rhodospirillales bacterium]|nr:NAD(P)-dependent oxidoreductase [Rhodospirillales bacterium]